MQAALHFGICAHPGSAAQGNKNKIRLLQIRSVELRLAILQKSESSFRRDGASKTKCRDEKAEM
eukprot:6178812-Pleurochrysis_carterae.AAC.3